MYWQRSW